MSRPLRHPSRLLAAAFLAGCSVTTATFDRRAEAPVLARAPAADLAVLHYHRRTARMGSDPLACASARRAMFVSTGVSLVVMVGSFVLLTWLNHAVVNAARFMKMAQYADALVPGVPNAELLYAVGSFVGAVVLLAVVPFPRPTQARGSR